MTNVQVFRILLSYKRTEIHSFRVLITQNSLPLCDSDWGILGAESGRDTGIPFSHGSHDSPSR